MQKRVSIITITGVAVLFLLGGGIYHKYRLNFLSESELFSLGQVKANSGDCKSAIEVYSQLLKNDPRHSVAMEYLAECQLKTGDVPGAILTYESAVKVRSMPKYWKRLLSLYQQTGQNQKAKTILMNQKTLLNPN